MEKPPEDLTGRQQGKLAAIAKTTSGLYRTYLLKGQLRQVFHQDTAEQAIALLGQWAALGVTVQAARVRRAGAHHPRTSHAHPRRARPRYLQASVESLNGCLRLATSLGFRSVEALIGLAMLAHGGLCPPLPGRAAA